MEYITIIDTTGRNILGVVEKNTDSELHIVNPVMISVQPQNGQFQVQLIPLFLAEFIAPDDNNGRNFVYVYSKSSIAVGTNFKVDPRITSQYEKIIAAANTSKPIQKDAKPEVIKLFEE